MKFSENIFEKSILITFLSSSFVARAIWITAFAGLTFIGAKIEIPVEPVPYTLQTLFVLLSGAFLGHIHGAMSQLLYLALGVIGIPVFAGPIAGISKILGPTGGYLLAFPVAAFITGYLIRLRHSFIWAVKFCPDQQLEGINKCGIPYIFILGYDQGSRRGINLYELIAI
jgi:hypothetical protein